MIRTPVVAITAGFALLLLLPAFAFAAKVNHIPTSPTISLVADPGQTDVVNVSSGIDADCAGVTSPCYLFADSAGVTVPTLNNDCVASPPIAKCSAAGVSGIDLDLVDLDDQATIAAAIHVTVRAGAGSDIVNGGPAADTLLGQGGADTLNGGDGDDLVYGNEIAEHAADGGNVLLGGNGNDTLDGGDMNDSIDGGPGDDALVGFEGSDTLTGGDGTDAFSGGDGDDTLDGQGGDDTLGAIDQQGPFSTPHERGNDVLNGGPGDDLLRAGPGTHPGTSDSDTLNGGDGRDTVDYAARTESVTVLLDGTRNDGAPGEGDDVTATIEAVASGAGDDRIIGTNASETFNGGDGDDVLDGGAGADTLLGTGGDDDLFGGRDADTLDGGYGEDYIEGGPARDTMSGGDASDTLATRDGDRDALAACGPRTDFAIADQKDKLSECDRFDKNSADRPVLGNRAALRPLKGNVEVRLPGTGRFIPLRAQADVPVGVRVDASGAGDHVRVTMAARGNTSASKRRRPGDRRKAKQRAVFSGGAFSVVQHRSRRPVTDIRLVGGNFTVCKNASRGLATSSALRDRVRELLGKGNGRFRTNGRYSATIVHGTTWLTQDRCDGTLTTVRDGTVVVRDFAKRRDVVVRKGDRYLARPK